MRRSPTVTVCCSLLLVAATLPLPAYGTQHELLGHTPHPPIRIEGDHGTSGFALGEDPVTGEPIHRPGSGVVAGSGTPADPYVIAGWQVPSITIEATTAHVIVRDNVVGTPLPEDPLDDGRLELQDAANVQIRENTVPHLSAEGASALSVDGNTAGSVSITGSDDAVVTDNQIDGRLLVDNSRSATVDANRIEGSVWLREADGATVRSNTIGPATGTGVEQAGLLLRTSDARLEANTFQGGATGLVVRQSTSNEVLDNRIEDGLSVEDSPSNTFDANRILAPSADPSTELRASPGTTFTGNQLDEGGFQLAGPALSSFQHTISANTVGGDPLVYRADVRDATVTGPAAQVILANATGTTVSSVSTTGPLVGVHVAFSDDVDVTDVQIDDAGCGILLDGGTGHRVARAAVDDTVFGVAALGTTDLLVEDSSFHGDVVSVGLTQTTGSVLRSSTIESATTDDPEVIRVVDRPGDCFERDETTPRDSLVVSLLADGPTLDTNTLQAAETILLGTSNALVTSNTIHAGQVHLSAQLTPSSGNRVTSNTFSPGQIRLDDRHAPLTGTVVDGNQLDGGKITVSGTDGEIRSNTIRALAGYDEGIVLGGERNTVSANTITDKTRGISVQPGQHLNVTRNTVTGGLQGIRTLEGATARIENNTITGTDANGIALQGPGDGNVSSRVLHNDLEDNGIGIWIEGDENHVRKNQISHNRVGITLSDEARDNEIHANNIEDNTRMGLDARDPRHGAPVNASRNWWGCAAGPSDPACDDVDGVVTVDPWLTSPVSDAGVQ